MRRSTERTSGELAQTYGEYYFQNCCGVPYQRDQHWLSHFGSIADNIARHIAPDSVLDVGCAMGFLVEALRDRGVEAFGIDISEYAIERVREDIRPFCRVGSATDELDRQYRLIVSIETLEHLAPADAVAAIGNFCRHTEDVLFSSTPIDQSEISHVNVQPPEYWAELFAYHAFFRDVDFDAGFVTPWAVRFRRSADPPARAIAKYERRFSSLSARNAALETKSMQLQTAVEAAHDEVTELRGQLRSAQENFERAARMLSDSEEELARTSEQLKRLTDEVSTIRGTLGWRAMNAARRALPARSRRGALARRAIRALRTRSR